MIDLHLHTTASDGRSTPEALVREAAAAGIAILAVTDHDTVAGVRAARAAAATLAIEVVTGIEITAVHDGRDVHVLGYFIDDEDPDLLAFLRAQRADRERRVTEIAARLAAAGTPIDVAPILAGARESRGRAVGRPQVAAALVAAGHAVDISDAFDRFLSPGRPAFVERRGSSPSDVIDRIARAGGVSSLAHPGKTGIDDEIQTLMASGLHAVEAFHPDHTPEDTARYAELASRFGLLVTGGSDYHGPGSGRSDALGRIGLPEPAYRILIERRSSGGDRS